MNREDIIRMAQEAGWDAHHAEFDTRIQTFFALVIQSLKPSLQTEFEKMFMEGASAEREACAKLCEQGEFMTFGCVAAAIQARGQA
jgi:hypothetical protein